MPNRKQVCIDVELTECEARRLALFIKRLRFDQVLELTDSGQSREARDEQAYAMLYAIDLVAGALESQGYAPR